MIYLCARSDTSTGIRRQDHAKLIARKARFRARHAKRLAKEQGEYRQRKGRAYRETENARRRKEAAELKAPYLRKLVGIGKAAPAELIEAKRNQLTIKRMLTHANRTSP